MNDLKLIHKAEEFGVKSSQFHQESESSAGKRFVKFQFMEKANALKFKDYCKDTLKLNSAFYPFNSGEYYIVEVQLDWKA